MSVKNVLIGLIMFMMAFLFLGYFILLVFDGAEGEEGFIVSGNVRCQDADSDGLCDSKVSGRNLPDSYVSSIVHEISPEKIISLKKAAILKEKKSREMKKNDKYYVCDDAGCARLNPSFMNYYPSRTLYDYCFYEDCFYDDCFYGGCEHYTGKGFFDLDITVREEQSFDRLSDVKIRVFGPENRIKLTDSDGEAVFFSMYEGCYDITASKEDYLSSDRFLCLDDDEEITIFLNASDSFP